MTLHVIRLLLISLYAFTVALSTTSIDLTILHGIDNNISSGMASAALSLVSRIHGQWYEDGRAKHIRQ
jgi:hypothetical protein